MCFFIKILSFSFIGNFLYFFVFFSFIVICVLSCPDSIKLGKAYGFKTFRIKEHKETDKIIKKVMETKGPVLVEVLVEPIQPYYPKPPQNALNSEPSNPSHWIICGRFYQKKK